MPFISVIIPLFNKQNFIYKTIKSVINQSYQDFEIIIVNDGSTDNSFKIVSQIKSEKITLINQQNQGLSTARNVGISKSTGTIVALLDADDEWLPSYLENIKYLHDNFPEATLYGTSYYEKRGDKKHLINTNLSKKLNGKSFIVEDFFKANLFQFIPCQSSIAFKKSELPKNPFNKNISYAEDVDFYLNYCPKHKLALKNSPLTIVNFGLTEQMSKNSISTKQIVDLDFYENLYQKNISISKYINVQRYKLAIKYVQENNLPLKKDIVSKLDFNHLTVKQKILLKLPRSFLLFIRTLKKILLKFNIRLTTN